MANNIYHSAICRTIDFKISIKEKLDELVSLKNDNIMFSKNVDGSILCCINYKGYDVSLRITENEVFQNALKRGDVSETLKEIITNKLIEELMKADE